MVNVFVMLCLFFVSVVGKFRGLFFFCYVRCRKFLVLVLYKIVNWFFLFKCWIGEEGMIFGKIVLIFIR